VTGLGGLNCWDRGPRGGEGKVVVGEGADTLAGGRRWRESRGGLAGGRAARLSLQDEANEGAGTRASVVMGGCGFLRAERVPAAAGCARDHRSHCCGGGRLGRGRNGRRFCRKAGIGGSGAMTLGLLASAPERAHMMRKLAASASTNEPSQYPNTPVDEARSWPPTARAVSGEWWRIKGSQQTLLEFQRSLRSVGRLLGQEQSRIRRSSLGEIV